MKPLRPRLLLPLALLGLLAACGGDNTRPQAPVAGQPVAPQARPVKIGIALGGGAAKGFAHIGVIKMLEANGFEPVVVSGTSAGSVVGALYASGMDAFEMQQKAVALDQASIRDVRLFSGGLVQGQKLQDYVNAQVGNKPAEKLHKPFAAVATQLETGDRAVFVRGNVGQAVRASSSIPGVFEPVPIGKAHYVDGGVVSPVPVDAARQLGADFVIAVDISSKATGTTPTGMLGIVNQSIAIMGQRLGEQELARADVIIRPQVLDIGATDFEQRGRAILEGEKAAMAAMPQIRARIAELQQQWLAQAQQKEREKAAQDAARAQAECLAQQGSVSKLLRRDSCAATGSR
ncbi:patatin-like phospholipase family protein [Flavobacterium sp. MXW15]|uniref:Patatin-like phospholipase family protein n=1 Tax=Xanthomonas chitinilytica TaxID=2989819 RepID=A0ABT3JX75_9XANT|nr:patatin-like phospholipase family protein [Xanthomonas sp. H13-6]MCW4455265.1 patatin-like phospholipase family protein [Flavobacterium sp. MXW15]MCW4473092.1 patatin-like phospholipase family protein [Xanthomonas sp. H13-6]